MKGKAMAKMDPEEVEKRLKREAADEALAKLADQVPAVGHSMDDDFDKGMQEILGMSKSELQKELNKAVPGISQKEIDEAIRDAKAAQAAMKGSGWLGKPDPQLAERIMMRNGKISELRKQKNKGCAVITLAGLIIGSSVLGGLIYGAAEAFAAVLH